MMKSQEIEQLCGKFEAPGIHPRKIPSNQQNNFELVHHHHQESQLSYL